MAYELVGPIISRLPDQTGQGQKGPWIKREFVIETPGQYPKPVKFEAWGDKGDVLKGIKKGQELRVQFDLDGRESNGKYYVSLRAFKIELVGETPVAAPKAQPKVQRTEPAFESERNWEDSGPDSELPF